MPRNAPNRTLLFIPLIVHKITLIIFPVVVVTVFVPIGTLFKLLIDIPFRSLRFSVGNLFKTGQQFGIAAKTSVLEATSRQIAQIKKLNLAAKPPGKVIKFQFITIIYLFHCLLTEVLQKFGSLFHILTTADINRRPLIKAFRHKIQNGDLPVGCRPTRLFYQKCHRIKLK